MTEPGPPARPVCRECQQPLLLVREGRDTCARCDSAAGRDVYVWIPSPTPSED